jgi:hypothetical protein
VTVAKRVKIVPAGPAATGNGAFMPVVSALGKIKKHERLAFIKVQMEEWTALMMKEIDTGSDETNSQSKGISSKLSIAKNRDQPISNLSQHVSNLSQKSADVSQKAGMI